ncbi:MAG: M13 family metallopeptidase [Gammaproteobacteria bacterium]|nr:M13 family metallopeptidase [Gammaproteobacteria bacterium]MXZ29043.1 M13 family metallopeptidase [Gammaproteobacteria bacterium]MYF59555.1 M13 family metallopeptidase [Gammaproteobacteria bacterium]
MTRHCMSRGSAIGSLFLPAALLVAGCGIEDPGLQADRGDQPLFGAWGFDVAAMNPAITPGDDFYEYVNGRWIDDTSIPADRIQVGSRAFVRERNDALIEEMILEFARPGVRDGLSPVERKIGDLYASFIDLKLRNERGIGPIDADLDRIRAISERSALVREFARHKLTGGASPITGFVETDFNRPDRQVFFMDVGGLGIYSPGGYTSMDDMQRSNRAAYARWVGSALERLGFDAAEGLADDVVALETRLAAAHPTAEERHDYAGSVHGYTLGEVAEAFPGFDWSAFFGELGIDHFENLIVRFPRSVATIVEIVNGAPLEVWKAYLCFHLLHNNVPYLDSRTQVMKWELFDSVISGRSADRSVEDQALRFVQLAFSFEIGRAFVERHFSPAAKAEVESMFEQLKRAFRRRLQQLDWMDDESKQEAFVKLDRIRAKIAYPDAWRSEPDVTIGRASFFENLREVRADRWAQQVQRVGIPPDPELWGMVPQAAGAGFHPALNEITIPAGNLMPPFFDDRADPAINYGAIGGVMGHELLHAFDDLGRRFDAAGALRDWWTPKSAEAFNQQARLIVDQFSRYEPLPGRFVNGKLTLGENIADIFGLTLALDAYRASDHWGERIDIDGFTPEQRFFFGWAQMRREKFRLQTQMQLLETDPHSPGSIRVNGVVRNIDAWYGAFSVEAGDALYLAPEARAAIW